MDRDKEQTNKEACRLRELFRGRFDQDTAVKLITELGGLLPATDFIFNEKEEDVSKFLKQSTTYLQSLREDSKKVASLLENKIEDSVRQFVCGDCKRSWWKRVPLRKEVSRCRRCKVRYDPVPREHETGLGSFKCICGNEFTGYACMGETLSECYECGAQVPVDHMVPPRRNRQRRTKQPHSCNGVNCFNSSHNHGQNFTGLAQFGSHAGADLDRYSTSSDIPIMIGSEPSVLGGRPRIPRIQNNTHVQGNFEPADPGPVCVHPKSQKKPIKYVSKKHRSTGSTVSTFLSQNSIETQSISVVSELYSIDE
ncbi:unnamed protein product [Candidula unifasciata]|uniref:Uncharacterized protein n=1 Tax=Candidula unifasciata TaxID=100452 RepID=A0A8S3YSY9_9EUPU|nr:unnamed protein product [Candidula unifasciata]